MIRPWGCDENAMRRKIHAKEKKTRTKEKKEMSLSEVNGNEQ